MPNLEDNAQEHEAKMWLQRQQVRPAAPMFEPGDAGYGPEDCECGEPMLAFWRRHGWRCCTPCRAKAERKR